MVYRELQKLDQDIHDKLQSDDDNDGVNDEQYKKNND